MSHRPNNHRHPTKSCCSTGKGCTALAPALKQAMAPPAGAYVAPQEASSQSVGKVERKRRRGGVMVSMSKLMEAAEREANKRSGL